MRFEYELSNIIKGYKTSYDRNQFVRSLVQFVKERNDPELQLTDAKKKKLLEQEYRENFGFFMGLPSDFMSLVIKALLDIKDCNFLPRLLLGQCTTQAKIQTFCSLIDLILIMSPDEEEHVYSAARYALVKAMHSPVMTRHNKTVAQKVLSQDSAFILEFIGTKLFKDDMYKRSFWMHDENEQQCFIDRLKDYPEILHRLIATCEYVETQMLLLSQKRAENNSEYNRKTLLYALASLPPNGVDRLANVFSRTDANGENFYVYIDEPKDDGPDQKEGEGLLKMLTSKEGVNGDTVMHQLARHHSGSVLDSVREIAARKPERLTELLCVEDRQKNTPLTVLLKKTPNVFTEIMQLIMTNDYYQPSYNKVMRKFLSQVEESKKLFGQWLLEIKPQDVVLVFNELFSTDSYDWIDQLKEYSTLVRKKVLTSFLQMMDARTAMTNFSREFITFCNDEEMFTDADSQSGAMYDNYVTMISQVDPETIKNMILPEKVLEDVVCLIVEQGKLQRQSEDYYYSGREAKRRDEERLKHYWRLVAKAVIQGRNHSRFESLLESVLSDDQSVCDFFGYDASIVLLKDDTIRPELKQKLFKNLIYNDHERVLMDAYTVSVQYITPAILRRNLIPPEENTAAFLHKLIIDDKSLFLRLLEGMLERYQKKCMAMKTNSSNNSEGMLPLFTVFMDQYPIESCAWICEHKEVFKALVNSDDKRLTNSINKSLSRLFIQQGEDVRELYDLLTKDRIITVHNEMVLSEYDNDTLISLSETLFDYVLKRRGNPFRIVESVYSRDCLAKDSIKKLVKSMASNSVLRNNISSFDATRMFFLLTDTDENELKRKHKKIPAEQQVKMGIELLSVFNKDGYLHILENSDGFNIRFFSYLHHLHTLKPNSSLLLEFMSQQLVGLDGWGSLRDMFFYNNTRSDIWNHVSPQTREFICKDFLTNATMRTLCSVAKYDFKFLLPAFPRATPAKCVIDWIIGRFESEQGDESCEAMSEWLTYTNMDWLNAEQVAKLFKSRLGFYLLRNNSDLFMKLRKKLKEDSFMFNYKHKEYGTYLDNIFRIYTGYQDTLIEACLEHVLNGLSKGSELGEKDVLQLDVIYKAWRKYQSGKKSVYSFISGFSLLRKFLNKSAQSLTPINEFYTIEKRSIKATKEEATDTLAEAVDYLDALERIYNGYDSSATEPEDLKVIESEVIKVCNALTGWLRSNPGELSEDQVDNIITMAKKVITRCWCPDGSKVSAMLQKEFRNLVDAYEHYLSLDPKWIDKLPVEAISDVKMMGHSSNYNDDDDDDDDYVRDVTNLWNKKFEPLLLKYYQNFFGQRFDNERYKQNLAEDPNDFLELFIKHDALFLVRFYNANERDGEMTVQHPLIRLLQDLNSLRPKDKSDISLRRLSLIVERVSRSYELGNLTFTQVDLIRKQIKQLKGIKSTRQTKDHVELWGYMSPKELTTHLKFKLKELKAKSKESYYKSLFSQLERGLMDPYIRPKSRSALKGDTSRFFITPPMDDNNRTAVVYDNWLNEVNQFSKKTKRYRTGSSNDNNSERRLFMDEFFREKILSRLIVLDFGNDPKHACELYEKVIATLCHCAGCPVTGPADLRKDNATLQSWLNKKAQGTPNSRKENFINSLKEFANCYAKDYDLVKNQGPRTKLKS